MPRKSNQQPLSQGPSPLYQQVKDYIVRHIESGRWPADARVPSEADLVRTHGVSRMTVNRALRELTAEGRLVRIQGVGTFVAAPKPVSPLVKIRSIDEEIREQGGRYSCRVLRLTREKASDRSAAAMNLEPGAEVFHSILIHYGSGRPVQYSDRLVNPAVAPDYINQDFTTITPSRYLLETAPVTEAEHVIEALIPPEEVRDHLDMAAHEPCLVLHRRTWTRRRVTTQSAFYYPGSRYRIGGRFSPSGGANLDVA